MRILVTGASGKLGSYLLQVLQQDRHDVIAWSGTSSGNYFGFPLVPIDLGDRSAVERAFRDAQPDAVIHTAAQSSVAVCLENPELARQINVEATRLIADMASAHSSRFVFVSTDMVFDGKRGDYAEDSPPAPLSTYGRSKVAAEQTVLEHDQHAVVRVSLLYGPTIMQRPAFFDQMLKAVRDSQPFHLFRDEWRTPLSLRTAAQQLLAAANGNVSGVLHLGGPERISRLEMGQRIAALLGRPDQHLVPTHLADATAPEPRAADLSLDSSRWRSRFPAARFPKFEEALQEMGLAAQDG